MTLHHLNLSKVDEANFHMRPGLSCVLTTDYLERRELQEQRDRELGRFQGDIALDMLLYGFAIVEVW